MPDTALIEPKWSLVEASRIIGCSYDAVRALSKEFGLRTGARGLMLTRSGIDKIAAQLERPPVDWDKR